MSSKAFLPDGEIFAKRALFQQPTCHRLVVMRRVVMVAQVHSLNRGKIANLAEELFLASVPHDMLVEAVPVHGSVVAKFA